MRAIALEDRPIGGDGRAPLPNSKTPLRGSDAVVVEVAAQSYVHEAAHAVRQLALDHQRAAVARQDSLCYDVREGEGGGCCAVLHAE